MNAPSSLNFFTVASSLWGGFPSAMAPLFLWNKKTIDSLGCNYFLICNKDCPQSIASALGDSIVYIEDLLDAAKQDLETLNSVCSCGGPNGRKFELECYKRFIYIKHLSDYKQKLSPIIHLDFDAIISSKYIKHTQEFWNQNTDQNIVSSFFYTCSPFAEFSKSSLDLFCRFFLEDYFPLSKGSDMHCFGMFARRTDIIFVDKKDTNNYFNPDYLAKGQPQLSICPWLSSVTDTEINHTNGRRILQQKSITDFIKNKISLNWANGDIIFNNSNCPLLHFQGYAKPLVKLLKFS